MEIRALRYLRRGQVVTHTPSAATETVLDYLRETVCSHGTKEGCAEGDCGACAVVVADLDGPAGSEALRFRSINSCIRFTSSLDGCAVFTVEDLRAADGALHPVQQAMVDCHGAQCGFCTPGFVMSLFGLYENTVDARPAIPVTRDATLDALSGNLCRCTGYRPIIDAAARMADYPTRQVDHEALTSQLRAIRPVGAVRIDTAGGAGFRPGTTAELLALRREHPDAQLIAGCTDVGLWVTKQHRSFDKTIDLTGVAELAQIDDLGDEIAIGAAVLLEPAYEALARDRPQLDRFGDRFASLLVRNSGTLGGNVANGSPIGDSMPLLIAMEARVVIEGLDEAGQPSRRDMALEDFYLGYRKNALQPHEVVTWIVVPKPRPDQHLRAYKLSKRFDQDISAVCLGVQLCITDGVVTQARIGAGGVAEVPKRARATEALLEGKSWNEHTVSAAAAALRAEFSPITDMRASSEYRREVIGNLLVRFWHETRQFGDALRPALESPTNLEGAWQ